MDKEILEEIRQEAEETLLEELYKAVWDGRDDQAKKIAAQITVYRDLDFSVKRKLKEYDNADRRAQSTDK